MVSLVIFMLKIAILIQYLKVKVIFDHWHQFLTSVKWLVISKSRIWQVLLCNKLGKVVILNRVFLKSLPPLNIWKKLNIIWRIIVRQEMIIFGRFELGKIILKQTNFFKIVRLPKLLWSKIILYDLCKLR